LTADRFDSSPRPSQNFAGHVTPWKPWIRRSSPGSGLATRDGALHPVVPAIPATAAFAVKCHAMTLTSYITDHHGEGALSCRVCVSTFRPIKTRSHFPSASSRTAADAEMRDADADAPPPCGRAEAGLRARLPHAVAVVSTAVCRRLRSGGSPQSARTGTRTSSAMEEPPLAAA
jgi:hypothetical protein